ncbi:patatin-like phospholipase family protein [Massilia sp. Dwa41.01b]|uniref:patatin-like phospholipase family protein n=1 Tax=Massilia sp. Dwa41.01b TaxID=2709302 RepID=UPI001E3842ED|nr:patatin-like phospholipase family protein [Massilia sp. Dwa41.01b]
MNNGIRKISLGLQGGGAYAAFGWGVLDRLLEDERFDIAAISATSGGAINAAVLADGYARGGGRAGARGPGSASGAPSAAPACSARCARAPSISWAAPARCRRPRPTT